MITLVAQGQNLLKASSEEEKKIILISEELLSDFLKLKPWEQDWNDIKKMDTFLNAKESCGRLVKSGNSIDAIYKGRILLYELYSTINHHKMAREQLKFILKLPFLDADELNATYVKLVDNSIKESDYDGANKYIQKIGKGSQYGYTGQVYQLKIFLKKNDIENFKLLGEKLLKEFPEKFQYNKSWYLETLQELSVKSEENYSIDVNNLKIATSSFSLEYKRFKYLLRAIFLVSFLVAITTFVIYKIRRKSVVG